MALVDIKREVAKWRAFVEPQLGGTGGLPSGNVGEIIYISTAPGTYSATNAVEVDPTDDVIIRHNSEVRIATEADGIVRISAQDAGDPGSGGAYESQIRFTQQTGITVGEVGYRGGQSVLDIANSVNSGIVRLLGASGGAGANRELLVARPLAEVELYFAGVNVAETLAAASGGFQINNTLTGAGFERALTVSDIGGLGVAGADTQLQFNDSGSFGADAELNWDGNTLEVENTTSAEPALRLNLGNNPSQGIRIETSLGTGYTALNMRDQTGTNFFRLRHDTSLSLPNNQLLIESSEAGDIIEISQDGEIIFCGYEGDPFVMDGVEQGRFTIQNNATMYMEQVLGAQSDRINYGQLWVRNPDIALMFTDEVGNTYQITPPGNQAAPATLALLADGSDSVASDVTVNDDAVLTGFTLEANQWYTFEAYIRFSVASGNGGARWDFNVSAGAIAFGFYSWFGVANDGPRLDEDSRDKVALSDEQTITITSGASTGIRIRGAVQAGGSGATIDFQFAQNVSDVGAITRQRGSWIRFTPVASA